jgi:hypothetical protein
VRLRQVLGSLDRAQRAGKVLGMANAAPDFAEQPGALSSLVEALAALVSFHSDLVVVLSSTFA